MLRVSHASSLLMSVGTNGGKCNTHSKLGFRLFHTYPSLLRTFNRTEGFVDHIMSGT